MHFVDFTFERLEGPATVPTTPIEGKFVQIRRGEDEFVVFAPKDMCKYHSNVVVKFAESRNAPLRENSSGDTVYFSDLRWEIVGGGWMKIDSENGLVEIGGTSSAYGPFDGVGLKSRLVPYFKGCAIVVST